jgi:hypothetical protein
MSFILMGTRVKFWQDWLQHSSAGGVSKNVCDGLCRVKLDSSGSPQRVDVELWPFCDG